LTLPDANPARGERLFEFARERDLEGVAKWATRIYQCDGCGTSLLKIKNPEYSQIQGRHELFDRKHRPPFRLASKLALVLTVG
jgi:hypothetical protein